MLSEENMTNRTKAARQFLRKLSQSGIGFLDRIITTDETWFHYYVQCQRSANFPMMPIDKQYFNCQLHVFEQKYLI